MVSSVSHSPDRQAGGLCLLPAHNFLFSILTATQYLEFICIHKLKMCQVMVMDRLMHVVTL
jgi:hypothetical protein